MMMPFAEGSSIWEQISAWWSRSWLMQNKMVQSRTQHDPLQQPRNAYQEVAFKRSRYSAEKWQKTAEDYRNKMCNLDISDPLRDYYENEAHLCDAEAKKIESR